ncbi:MULTISPECIES: DUF6124 family protein [Pseudomonas]|uniref:DUF3077 domain-containing protein n=1 Tax=Pseudomonas chlororaphis O6 TaxID=1037915 RepID=A0AB33WNS3_9PSED|nr:MULTISPECIES: DUF6124 family protein [Pseudomonas]AZD90265.1 hypothetical protein C4K13_0826 [Pseudomonas chlororaphis subsp. aureofaciens]EIM14680.1 hypothetical protein PchlO6_0795 [Pseudomonas chlororaphis O6]KAB0527900.1 hypothetical protein F7R16_25055 [Pseudomonas chlororaphis subsp. aureofaciens]TSD30680.1 hypothetical protein FCE86_014245 [Pseudomonas sp. ATCC 13985]WDG61295.1 DUF6124 family protein [Pseudomonas chlororaphis]
MKKITPNPPCPSASDFFASLVFSEPSKLDTTSKPMLDAKSVTQDEDLHSLFVLTPNIDTKTLLVHTRENLASLNALSDDLIAGLGGQQRSKALAIQQFVMLSELLVNRALEQVAPPHSMPAHAA